MSFASWSKMTPRARMMAGLRGMAVPTRAVEYSDPRGVRVGSAPLAGLGMTYGPIRNAFTAAAGSTQLSPTVTSPVQTASTLTVDSGSAPSSATFSVDTQQTVSPTYANRAPSNSGSTAPSANAYASGKTVSPDEYSADEPASDDYSYDDYQRSPSIPATADKKPAVFPVEMRPQPKTVGGTSVPWWVFAAGALAVGYFVWKG